MDEEVKKFYKETREEIDRRYILNPLIKKEEAKKGRPLTEEERDEIYMKSKEISKLNQAEKDILRRFSGKTLEEIRELEEVKGMNKYDRIRYAYSRVQILKDFIKLINSHKKDLEYSAIKLMVILEEFNAEQNLGPYIIMDIVSFYEHIHKLRTQENKISLPSRPDYFNVLKDFRDKIVGHIDKKGKLPKVSDWFIEYEKIDKIGLNKIINDFEEKFLICNTILTREEENGQKNKKS